ncbi:hypothetical protein WN944_006455 [Citrus x changshan-huyou]|uniref:RNase H type-1 domain-containing protein n=1 Tax=Citrus x changshan-huyou TaxID=2935761 RepID=A0AAP0MLP9_9ROSI
MAANVVNSFRADTLQCGTSKSIKPNTPNLGWQSPPSSWYKVNVDAAISFAKGRAGIGVLVRNSRRKVMAASICTVIFSRDIEFVEAIAVHKGLQLVMDIGLAPVIIKSDSLNVVNLISNKMHNRCEVGWLISDIQEVLSSSENSF